MTKGWPYLFFQGALGTVGSALRVPLRHTAFALVVMFPFFISVSCCDCGTLCSHQTGWRFSTGAEQSGIPGPFPLTAVTQALGSKLS